MRLVGVGLGLGYAPLAAAWSVWLAAALAGRRPAPAAELDIDGEPPRIAVLVPAHDEEAALPGLLESLGRGEGPRVFNPVLVVADHCSDRTAEVARAAGATVLERDSGPRGKPAALRDGLARLAEGPRAPEAVLIVDADCVCSENLAAVLARRLVAGDEVVQCANVIEDGTGGPLQGAASLGVALKNVVRPSGLARLGCPTQLLGTGMMFRRRVLDRLRFDDHLVEDLRMSHDLLRMGVHPRFEATARVTSLSPPDEAAMTAQRLRWEGGQMATWRSLPGLFADLARRRDLPGMVSLVDWSAPPLAMALAAWSGLTVLSGAAVAAGLAPATLLIAPGGTAALLGAYLILGATGVGGAAELRRLAAATPRYLRWKLDVYATMARGGGVTGWERTPRGPSGS